MDLDEKFVQIMPINHVIWAVYSALGTNKSKTEFKSRIFLAALTNAGDIRLLDADPTGEFADPTEASNFLRFEYE